MNLIHNEPPALCPICGSEVRLTATGPMCACDLRATLSDGPVLRVGPYECLERLDEGGTGVVYIARHREREGLVAIKIAHAELLACADTLAAFDNGLHVQHMLRDLPNIVKIEDLGTHSDGRPYAAMELYDAGTLHEPLNRKRFADPARALDALIAIANAVQSAHRRGVLHCDIKPSNVLLSAKDEPYVGDFGFAHVLHSAHVTPGAALRGGTPGWMSPEQVERSALAETSDVFSLGIFLYWLLTKRMPFGEGPDFPERVKYERQVPLRDLYRGPHRWELNAICEHALHKDPAQRYENAEELARDLVRTRAGEAISLERERPLRRLFKWTLRHKLAAIASFQLCAMLVFMALMPLAVIDGVEASLRERLESHALAQSGAVIGELRALSKDLERLALEPAIHALVAHDDPYEPPSALSERGFDGLSVFSAACVLHARWPRPEIRHPTLDFTFRDYCRGQLGLAHRGARDVYVARTFYSTGDEEPMLGLSTPLYEGKRHIGMLVGRTRTRGKFGALELSCGEHGQCTTTLLGPRDRDASGEPMPTSIYVLASPGLAEGSKLMLEASQSAKICKHLPCSPARGEQLAPPKRVRPFLSDDYVDPITAVRSLTALAPVGRTGLIVAVSTPSNAVAALSDRMTNSLKSFALVQVVLAAVLVLAAVSGQRRR